MKIFDVTAVLVGAVTESRKESNYQLCRQVWSLFVMVYAQK